MKVIQLPTKKHAPPPPPTKKSAPPPPRRFMTDERKKLLQILAVYDVSKSIDCLSDEDVKEVLEEIAWKERTKMVKFSRESTRDYIKYFLIPLRKTARKAIICSIQHDGSWKTIKDDSNLYHKNMVNLNVGDVISLMESWGSEKSKERDYVAVECNVESHTVKMKLLDGSFPDWSFSMSSGIEKEKIKFNMDINDFQPVAVRSVVGTTKPDKKIKT